MRKNLGNNKWINWLEKLDMKAERNSGEDGEEPADIRFPWESCAHSRRMMPTKGQMMHETETMTYKQQEENLWVLLAEVPQWHRSNTAGAVRRIGLGNSSGTAKEQRRMTSQNCHQTQGEQLKPKQFKQQNHTV